MVRLLRDINNIPTNFPGCVATMGNFDGVHIGHQQLIRQVTSIAKQQGLPSLVILFEPQSNEFFSPQVPPRLMRLREKVMALDGLMVDYVLCIRFNQEFASLSAEAFVQDILVHKLKLHTIVVGDDVRFGAKRRGDLPLLQQLGAEHDFSVYAMDTFLFAGERVSSSRVRQALRSADLDTAQALLGRRYGISGRVAHGAKRGRVLGFPTANIFPHRKASPVEGIFVVDTYGLRSGPVHGVADVGNRPTVTGDGRTLLEVHLFDFNETIYGKHIYVEFLHKLRDEQRYPSLELLQQQMLQDAKDARAYFDRRHS